MDNLLITLQDLQAIRPTAELDEERVSVYMNEAQTIDLQNLIGHSLYVDMMDNLNLQKYTDLIDGKKYTINGQPFDFKGLKPFLSYMTLSRFIVSNPINIVRFGVVKKLNSQSEPVSSAELMAEVNQLKSSGETHGSMILRFLNDFSTTYPYFKYAPSDDLRKRPLNFFMLE